MDMPKGKRKEVQEGNVKSIKGREEPEVTSLIEELRKRYNLQEVPPEYTEFISTGIPPLDWLFGGGLPLRAFVVFYGRKSSGKTTIAAQIAAQVQKGKGVVVWVDNEQSFSPLYFQALGGEPSLIAYNSGLSMEGVFKLMEDFAEESRKEEHLKAKRRFLFIWDSIAATPTEQEFSASFNQVLVGTGAKVLSFGFRKMALPLAKFPNISFLVINQVREEISAGFTLWGAQKKDNMYGGNALEHWAALFVHFKQVKKLEDIGGIVVRVQITKSKVYRAPLFGTVELVIQHGKGVNLPLTLFELAKKLKVLSASGGWYSWKGKKYRQSTFIEEVLKPQSESQKEAYKEFLAILEKEWRTQKG